MDSVFSDHCDSKRHLLLTEKSDRRIQIEKRVIASDAPYTDRFQVLLKWDILTADPLSQQVVLRQTFKMDWFDKPWALWRTIESTALDNTRDASDKLPEWYTSHAKEFLDSLETSEEGAEDDGNN